jgi:hypothetical protein
MKKTFYAVILITFLFSCNKKEDINLRFDEIKTVFVGTTHFIAVDLVPTKGYIQTDSFYIDTIRVRETIDSIFITNFLSGFRKNDSSNYVFIGSRYSSIQYKFIKPDTLESHSILWSMRMPLEKGEFFQREKAIVSVKIQELIIENTEGVNILRCHPLSIFIFFNKN